MPLHCILFQALSSACSKRSDSGEQCEVKKAMKSRGELGRAVPPSLTFIFSPSFLLRTTPHYLNAWNRLKMTKKKKIIWSIMNNKRDCSLKISLQLCESHIQSYKLFKNKIASKWFHRKLNIKVFWHGLLVIWLSEGFYELYCRFLPCLTSRNVKQLSRKF